MNKRGLSDVVTVTLIILLAVAAVVIVWAFVRSTLNEAGKDININALKVYLSVLPESIKIDEATKYVKFNIQRGAGGVEITGLKIILEDSKGNTNISDAPPINELETKPIERYYTGSGLIDIAKISVAPTIKNTEGNIVQGPVLAVKQIESPEKYSFHSFEMGLLSYYKFEDNTQDSAGNNHGTNNGCTFTAGKINKALTLNGINNYVLLDTSKLTPIESKGTISLWHYSASLNNAPFSISNGAGWQNEHLVIYGISSDNKFYIVFGNDISYQIKEIDNAPALNTWTHLAVTWDSTNYATYKNGIQIDSGPQTVIPLITGNAWIGRSQGLWGDYFNGKIDEVRIYNRALSDAEIKALYEETA